MKMKALPTEGTKAYIQAGTDSGKSGTHSNMYLHGSNSTILVVIMLVLDHLILTKH